MNQETLHDRAVTHLSRGENQEVADMKDDLLKESADNSILLAESYRRLERYSEAIDLCVKIPTLDASVLTAECLIATGAFKNAIAILANETESSPRDSRLWQNLGRCYFELKNFKKAQELFEFSIQCSPEDAWTHCYLAVTQWKNGHFEKADASYKTALRCTRNRELKRDIQQWHKEFLEATKDS